MMKKLLVLLFACLLIFSCACAESRQWQAEGSPLLYTMEDYTAFLPDNLRRALSASPFAQDTVLCATQITCKNTRYTNKTDTSALIAVDHNGSTLLLSLTPQGELTAIARDFNTGQDFYLTSQLPPYTHENPNLIVPVPFIVSGDRWIGVSLGSSTIRASFVLNNDGSGTFIDASSSITCYEAENFSYSRSSGHHHYPAVSTALWDWNILTWPCTHEEMQSLETAAPFDRSVVFASGCHLRAKATSKSTSLGQLCAYVPVRLTGNTSPGTQLPWHEIEIGRTRAWVSENYLTMWKHNIENNGYVWGYTEEEYLYFVSTQPNQVCRPRDAISLYESSNTSKALQALTAEDILTIAAESSKMYLVCVSTQQPGRMIPDGVYGWVRKSDVVTAPNPIQLAFE